MAFTPVNTATAHRPRDLDNFVGGEASSPGDAEMQPVTDPATGAVIARVPLSGPAKIDHAVRVAGAAFESWAATPVPRRARILFAVQRLLEENSAELAELIALENGKALQDARAEIMRGQEVLEFAAGAPTLMQGFTSTDVSRGVDAETRAYPLGVVAGITPFNFPGMIPLWMIPLAVACGNTFVLKPSEQTPMTARRLVELFHEGGLPAGVLNLVNGGVDAVNSILEHPDVAAISFVGSAPVARHVYRTGSAHGKRVQALAGAKNFLIVLDDAPLEASADAVFGSAFGNAGQRCLAGSIVLVTPEIKDSLIDALLARCREAPMGPGTEDESVVTPVISEQARERITAAIDRAVESGARVLTGEANPGGDGHFLAPTIVVDVQPDMEVFTEELFGPTLAVTDVADLEQAIALANTSEYGNSSSIFTTSGHAARVFREGVEAGMLGINIGVPAPIGFLPFSGWKGSFFGDLHANGRDGVRFYTRLKTITTRWPE